MTMRATTASARLPWLIGFVLIALAVLIGCKTPPSERWVTVDVIDGRVLIHDLVPDDWTVCVDDDAITCQTVGDIRAAGLFRLPELDGTR